MFKNYGIYDLADFGANSMQQSVDSERVTGGQHFGEASSEQEPEQITEDDGFELNYSYSYRNSRRCRQEK